MTGDVLAPAVAETVSSIAEYRAGVHHQVASDPSQWTPRRRTHCPHGAMALVLVPQFGPEDRVNMHCGAGSSTTPDCLTCWSTSIPP